MADQGIDWTSFGSALIGGGLAMWGTFVNGRLEHKARRDEAKSQFQRRTLIDLQDTIETFLRETYALHLWRDAPRAWEESNKQFAEAMAGAPAALASLSPFDRRKHSQELIDDGHLSAWTDSRFRIERLSSRVDNKAVRDEVNALIEATREVLTKDMMEDTRPIVNRLNLLIGRLVREGAVTDDGFVAPESTGRSLL